LVFSAEKIGDFSRHWSSLIGMPAIIQGAVRLTGGLDVDHLGPEHRQEMGTGRPGPERAHVQHA
jgi:hypothetical protein